MKKIKILLFILVCLLSFMMIKTNVKADKVNSEPYGITAEYNGGVIKHQESLDINKLFVYYLSGDGLISIPPTKTSLVYSIDDEEINIGTYIFELNDEEDQKMVEIQVKSIEYGFYDCFYVDVYREVDSFVISFNPGIGSGTMEQIIVNENETINVPECNFKSPDGLMFDCWTVNGYDDWRFYLTIDRIYVTEDLNLTAQYKSVDKVNAKITFDKGDGSGEMPDVTIYNTPQYYELPKCSFAAPDGKIFAYWLTIENGEYLIHEENATITVYDDLTLTALYIKKINGISYIDATYLGEPLLVGEKINPSDILISVDGGKTSFRAGSSSDLIFSYNDVYIPSFNDYNYQYDSAIQMFDVRYGYCQTTFEVEFAETVCIEYNNNLEGPDFAFYDSYFNLDTEITLDECIFTAPFGMEFAYWEAEDKIYHPGDLVNASEFYTFKAVWQTKDGQNGGTAEPNQPIDYAIDQGASSSSNHMLIAICIASGALVLGIGGFAIYWFVIKKKTKK